MPEIRFGKFRFDTRSDTLKAGKRTISLRPQAHRLLRILLENHGKTVSRNEIRNALWNGRTVSFDNSIEVCVRELRQALGDSHRSASYIKTVPHRGYRFIFPLKPQANLTKRPRIAFLFEAALGLVALAGFLLVLSFSIQNQGTEEDIRERLAAVSEATSLKSTPLLAVLPAPEQSEPVTLRAYEIIHDFSKISPENMRVVSLDSVRQLVEDSKTGRDSLVNMGITHVLWLSSRENNKPGFRYEVENLKTRAVNYSGHFSPESEPVIPFETRVVAALSPLRVASRNFTPVVFREADNRQVGLTPPAKEAYYLGRFHFFNNNIKAALEALEKAQKLAPESSRVLSALAYTLTHSAGDQRKVAGRARDLAIKALERDPANEEALVVLGSLALFLDWDLGRAEELLETALNIRPGSVQVLHSLAAANIAGGHFQAGIDYIDLAAELDPLAAAVTGDRAWFLLLAGNYEKSLAACEKLESILQEHFRVLTCYFNAYVESGRYEEAVEYVPKILNARGIDPGKISEMTRGPAEKVLNGYWNWRLNRLYALDNPPGTALIAAAQIHARLGQEEEALSALDRAADLKPLSFPFVFSMPAFRTLLNKKEFQALNGRFNKIS